MRRLVLLLALLPAVALGQTAVSVSTTDTVQSACVLNALNATCTIPLRGKASAAFIATAASSPSLTILPEVSADGTTYVATIFDDPATSVKATTLVNPASGTTRTLFMAGGMRFARVRVSAYTSGSVTISVVGTDSGDNSAAFAAAPGASNAPIAVATMGAQDSTTATTLNALKSGVLNTTPGAVPWLLSAQGIARSAVVAETAGNVATGSFDSTNGSMNVRLTDSTTYLAPQVNAHNTAAPGAALAEMPGIARSALSAATAGRSTALSTDVTNGSLNVRLTDSATYLAPSVLANDATAIANGLGVQPAVSRATPTATTAGRGEMLQVETVTGALYVSGVATTIATGTSTAVVTVNTTTGVKASAGNVYGVSCSNANASVCFLQFYNANAPTCGTSVVWSLAIPTSGTLTIPPGQMPMANHATGIGVCMGTTATGATACSSANACTIFYK